MNAFKFGSWMQKVADDPMAAINAKRVADMKAMASKVQSATGKNGPGTYSGRVLPNGSVANPQYTPSAQQNKSFGQKMLSPPPNKLMSQTPQPQKQLTWDDEEAWDSDVDQSQVVHTPGSLAAAKQTSQRFNNINAGAGGAGRGGMASSPPPVPQPSPPVQTQPNPPAPVQQSQTQSASPSAQPTMWQRFRGMMPGQTNASSWANQTNSPQAGPLSAPLSNVSNSFNNATGQQDPPHIITTDNGRKFNTQTKQFLDGRPGGF